MAKGKSTVFFCQSCGYESPKWMGQCPGCREWNTFVEETVVKIIDLESEIYRDIDALVDLKRDIQAVINNVEDEKYRILLELRYINQMSWEEIAVHLGYDLRYTHKIHGRALQKVTVPEKRH